MPLSDYEIEKITEIVAGRVGEKLDGKALRQIVDRVVDGMQAERGNPDIKGATCEVSAPSSEVRPNVAVKDTLDPLVAGQGGLYDQIEKTDATRVIIAAFGQNRPGVVASISGVLAEENCSIEDISQTLMQEFFSMIMVVNMSDCKLDFAGLRDKIQTFEAQLGMKVYVMHEDIFRYMHRI